MSFTYSLWLYILLLVFGVLFTSFVLVFLATNIFIYKRAKRAHHRASIQAGGQVQASLIDLIDCRLHNALVLRVCLMCLALPCMLRRFISMVRIIETTKRLKY